MKILMLNYEYPPVGGGGAPATENLAKTLALRGHKVDVLTMHFRGLPLFEAKDGVRIFRVPSLRVKKEIGRIHEMISFVFAAALPVIELVRKEKYDLVHAHFIYPTAILALLAKKAARLPLVITSHGSDVPGYNPDRFIRIHKALKRFWLFITSRADAIISPSEYHRELIISNGCKAPIFVINHGFTAGAYRKTSYGKRILVVSRLFKRKGVQYLLEAVRDMDTDYEIAIVGDGPHAAELKKMAEGSKPRIVFAGYLQDHALAEYYETSSIFVFTSLNETFGMVLLEAMNAGLAVITTDTSACPEVVKDSAILVKPQNASMIREALQRLICDPELVRECGARALERAKYFTWERAAAETELVYNKVVK